MLWPKKNSYKEFDNEKNSCGSKIPLHLHEHQARTSTWMNQKGYRTTAYFFLCVKMLNMLFLEALRLNDMPGFLQLILADFAVSKEG